MNPFLIITFIIVWFLFFLSYVTDRIVDAFLFLIIAIFLTGLCAVSWDHLYNTTQPPAIQQVK